MPSPPTVSQAATTAAPLRRWLVPRLLGWFDRCQRDLPWRRDRDPYRVWVSEVMLQQTQVVTVIPYFERFLLAFPTLIDLARASEQEVLRLWEGLGYYRRARDLHRSARVLAADHGGSVPDDPDIIGRLPGFGVYTRNAVLSQAFDRRLPIIEANSQRLLSRLFGRDEDPRSGPARKWLWSAAETLLPARRVGAFNQALMELGALVCMPTAPKCSECPLARRCIAFQTGRQESIPPKASAPVPTPVLETAVVVRRGERILLVQRPEKGRWAGMWEFPRAELLDGERPEAAADRVVAELTGVKAKCGPELMTIRHGVTRFRITLICFEAQHMAGEFTSAFYRAGLWLREAELEHYPVSAPQRRLARFLSRR